jgi:uncharacterized protein YciI
MRSFFPCFIVLGLLSATAAQAQDAAKQNFFVLVYTQGPAWKPGVPMAKQGLGAHLAYMTSLRDAHELFVAGPLDDNGGLILVRAKNMDDVKHIMAVDPAITSGLFTGEAHTWRAAVDSGKTASDFLAAPE